MGESAVRSVTYGLILCTPFENLLLNGVRTVINKMKINEEYFVSNFFISFADVCIE